MRLGFVTVAVAAGILIAPTGASAAESCVYQGVQTTNSRDKAGSKRPGLTRQEKVEHALLCLTNLHRVRNGLQPLLADSRLNAAARLHSTDMVNRGFFDHTNPEGADPSTRAMAAGYPGGAAENIAANGTGTAASLFTQWKDSAGHNATMLTAGYLAAGMGVAPGFPGAPGPGAVTGTQMFGLAQPNTGYTGFDLYANNEACAKWKLSRLNALEHVVGKKGLAPKISRKLDKARKKIRRVCKPPI